MLDRQKIPIAPYRNREEDVEIATPVSASSSLEVCLNPFFKAHGHSNRIELYIVFHGDVLPICSECWRKLNDQRREVLYQWGDSDLAKELGMSVFDTDLVLCVPEQ